MNTPKFKVGDIVELVGIYKSDKGVFQKKCGRIIHHSTDPEQLLIGGSLNVYQIEGVGTYGESALKLKS